MSGDPFLLLLVLASGLAFTFGGCIGAQLTVSAYRERDEQHAQERRLLNEIWRALRDEVGIDRATWITADLVRERTRKHSRSRRGMSVTRGRSTTPRGDLRN